MPFWCVRICYFHFVVCFVQDTLSVMTVMQFSASRQKLVPSTFTLIYLSCILLLNPCTRELTTQLVFLQTYLNLDSTCNFTENFSLYFSKNT